MTDRPIIVWFRQDLRLTDNPALSAALEEGRPILPLFILDAAADGRPLGGAGLWWLERSLAALDRDLRVRGSRLILRRGPVEAVLAETAKAVDAAAVFYNRLYGAAAQRQQARLPGVLDALGVRARSFNARLLIEPAELRTGTGEAYKVFTPFWRAARSRIEVADAAASPKRLSSPTRWPKSDALKGWRLYAGRPDWAAGFDWTPGEAGAQAALDRFLDDAFAHYAEGRDRPAEAATSRLSPHLHWGEIGPRQVWRAAHAAAGQASDRQLDKLLSELGWREFNHHLLDARPDLARANVRPAFDRLPWRTDPEGLEAWGRGRTGYPIVDAGMRELWRTGWMHNRVRLIVGSFLVKDLLIDWREGERWFWDTLVDADEANNPANWQWVAGTGADAAPFFRIFNPTAQAERFDPDGDYVRRWIPELAHIKGGAVHRPWDVGPSTDYPGPILDHGAARLRALEAFRSTRLENLQDVGGRRAGDLEGADGQLHLHLQGLHPDALLGEVRVHQVADPRLQSVLGLADELKVAVEHLRPRAQAGHGRGHLVERRGQGRHHGRGRRRRGEGRRRAEAEVGAAERQILGLNGQPRGAVVAGQEGGVPGARLDQVHPVEGGVVHRPGDLVAEGLEVVVQGRTARGVQAGVGGGQGLLLHLHQQVGDLVAGGHGDVDGRLAALQRFLHRIEGHHPAAHRLGDRPGRGVVLGAVYLAPGGDARLHLRHLRLDGGEGLQRLHGAGVGVDAEHRANLPDAGAPRRGPSAHIRK
jgi:deoxyribodipyrimidine photo-lyase